VSGDAAEASNGESRGWREAAVARSLDPARARVERRVQRYLDAANELLVSERGRDFTVQEVVERSGQSLRGFYQYFAGKHELLLALFEESVRSAAAYLRNAIVDLEDPLERLHQFAVEYYGLCRPAPKRRASKEKERPSAAMAEFAQQLLTEHAEEAAQAFAPLVALLETLLDDAAAAGEIRAGLDHTRIAGVVLQAVMFNVFAATISGASPRVTENPGAEVLWDLLLFGISPR
jgi:AcrR family transcriptional regulator